MEDKEQNHEEYGNTPNLVRKHLIRLVRSGSFEFFFVFAGYDRREVLGYVFISRVRNQRLEIVAENIVVERLFERADHSDRFFMHFHFDLVVFDKFNGVEQRVCDVLTFERDFYVADNVRKRRILQNGNAYALFLALVISLIHKFFKTFFFESGNLYDGYAEFVFKGFFVDFIACFFNGVDHVESDDHRNVYFEKLSGKIKVTL